MNISDLKQSKFLKKEDVGVGMLVTICALTEANVSMEGAEPQMKTILHFNEQEKGMVLNSTNAQLIAKITGIETDIEKGWVGHKIVLYADPSITLFGGKLVGGIRVRAPKTAAGKTIQQPADDNLGF